MYRIISVLPFVFIFIGVFTVIYIIYTTIFEKRREIFITYIISSIIAFVLSDRVTLKFGINGAAILYALLMCLTALMFGMFCIVAILNKSKKV